VSSPVNSTIANVDVRRWRDGEEKRLSDRVAEEIPVAILYNGVPHVVMMATPQDLDELAIGFSVSEAIVERPGQIQSIETMTRADGAYEVHVGIDSERLSLLLRRERNLTGRTGCGLCGTEKLEDAIRPQANVGPGVLTTTNEIHRVLRDLGLHQPINAQTGSAHAAAWVLPGGEIEVVREDVGRHNALDKVIGAIVRADDVWSRGYFVITSRASYEMVQKTAAVGVSLLVAVSAPTAFAIRLADSVGMTLVGFARENQHVIYSHANRVSS
jgi:FdhD protein